MGEFVKAPCGCLQYVSGSFKSSLYCTCEECPACGELISQEYLSTDLEGNSFDDQCPHCEVAIHVEVDWEPQFSLSTIHDDEEGEQDGSRSFA